VKIGFYIAWDKQTPFIVLTYLRILVATTSTSHVVAAIVTHFKCLEQQQLCFNWHAGAAYNYLEQIVCYQSKLRGVK
jgi:hypothetical protein